MEPNPQIISQAKELEEDRNTFKIFLLAVLGVIFIFTAVSTFNLFITTASGSYFLWAIVSSVLFLTLTVLQVFFIKSGVKLFFILFFESALTLIIFYKYLYPKPSLILLSAPILLFIFLALAVNHGSKILSNSIKIHFIPVARTIIPKAVTGLLLFLVILVYLNYFEWGRFNEKLGQALVNQTLIGSTPAFRIWTPQYSYNQTTQNFLEGIAENQLNRFKPKLFNDSSFDFESFNFDNLPAEQKKLLISQAAKELESTFEDLLGGPLNSNEPLNLAAYRLTKDYFKDLAPQAKSFLGIIIAAFLFFFLKGVAILFYWLIEFLSFILFKFLIAVGFAYVSLETRSREFVLLK